jgi:glutaredoxin
MASPTLHHVVLFARSGCHLCDVARATLEAVRSRHPFVLQEVDIETDDALVREYGMRIPVVAVDGHDMFEIDVPEARLAALVRM